MTSNVDLIGLSYSPMDWSEEASTESSTANICSKQHESKSQFASVFGLRCEWLTFKHETRVHDT